MGGNALKHTQTRRYNKGEYFDLTTEVLWKLNSIFNAYGNRKVNIKTEAVKAYADKSSYGDLDILVENHHAKEYLTDQVLKHLGFGEVVKNGMVWSLGYGDFQVDLIFAPPQTYTMSQAYFNYNDLGNLMGRIAHGVGFKYGSAGLQYKVMDGTRVVDTITLTTWPSDAFQFLGFDYDRYLKGFKNLEEIFEYVTSNKYFTPSIFNLENRNHAARTRDRKRDTYTKFLEYIKDMPESTIPNVYDLSNEAKSSFPWFRNELIRVYARHQDTKTIKNKFNGNIVSTLTGYSGKDLGLFIVRFKEYIMTKEEVHEEWRGMSDFMEWVLSTPQEGINQDITIFKELDSKE